jgi:co-chaperonin GroES (HSP10)
MTNESGINPLGAYVLIALPAAQEKIGSVFIPTEVADKDRYGTQRGTVLAAGPSVGRDDKGPNGHDVEPGQQVAFARYAGTMVKGSDGEDYRLIMDVDVKGIYHGG